MFNVAILVETTIDNTGLQFCEIFVEKYTVTIWRMWGKKMIKKSVYRKRKNFLKKNCNPNKVNLEVEEEIDLEVEEEIGRQKSSFV